MIHYIIGRAGYGKTRTIYRQIKEKMLKDPQAKCILLVPELFTLQAERELIHFLGTEGLLQAEVLSFSSLSRRVLEETGADRLVVLRPLGKILLLKKILLEKSAQLNLYGQVREQNGILEQLTETLEELGREGVTSEKLRELSEQGSDLLKRKLQDLALLQEDMEAYMEGHYLDEESSQQLVLSNILSCRFLQNSFIWIDGFSGFTTPHRKTIEQLLRVVQDLTISFTMDLRENIYDRDLFEPVRVSWEKIRRFVKNVDVQEGPPIFLTTPFKANKSAALRHLERWAFAFPTQPYHGTVDQLKIHETKSPYAEVKAAACQILAWTAEKHLRWREIGVAVFQLETYAPLIERVFQAYGIPGFVSKKHTMMHQPIVQFLFATLESVRKNMRFEDVFAAFKTGLGLFPREIYEELENYCLAWGIEGKRWQRPFTAGNPERLEQFNQWREEFLLYANTCFPALQTAKTYEDFTRGLYQCIETLRIREKLLDQIITLREQGNMELASQIEQAWKYCMEIMDQLVEILGEQPVTALQYIQILQAGIASVEVGVLPDRQDQVIIGDMQQILMPEVKALWVMGFHDGVLPAANSEKGVLLTEEKEFFRENGAEISLSPELKIMQEYYHVYQTITRAQQWIHFSYALSDGKGSGRKPAVFLEQFTKIFPDVPYALINEQPEPPSGSRALFPFLVDRLCDWRDDGKPLGEWKQAYTWYAQHPRWKGAVQNLERALFHTNQPVRLDKQSAYRLYEQKQIFPISISRMENYAKCPFSQLVRYGLHPEERKQFALQAPDIGEYMHFLLENYGHKIDEKRLQWKDLDRSSSEILIQEVLQAVPEDYGKGVFQTSFRNQYVQRRLNQMFRLSAWMLTCQIGSGEYQPFYYELKFGRYGEIPPVKILLQDGKIVLLEGRIDRVDLYPEQDKVWIRIVDYKTGAKTFQLSDLYNGLEIQLALYAIALLNGWDSKDHRVPQLAGMFFFHLDEPWLEEKNISEPVSDAALLKEFRLNGVLLKDVDVIQSMDRTLQAGSTSAIIPAGLLKNQMLSAKTTAFSSDALRVILQYVQYWLKEKAQEMLQGKCEIRPTNDGKGNTACKYCSYHAICQFDLSLPDNQYRWLRKYDPETVIEQMKLTLEKDEKEES